MRVRSTFRGHCVITKERLHKRTSCIISSRSQQKSIILGSSVTDSLEDVLGPLYKTIQISESINAIIARRP
jgi:hypothetical protein